MRKALKLEPLPRAYIKVGCLKVTTVHLRVTIGHLRVTMGHLRVTLGHLRVTIGHLRVTKCHSRVTIGYWLSKAKVRLSKAM